LLLLLVKQLFSGSVYVPTARRKSDPGSLLVDPHVLQALEQGVVLGVGVAGTGVGRGPVLSGQPEDLLVVAVLAGHDGILVSLEKERFAMIENDFLGQHF
jgi:hypothetical protein